METREFEGKNEQEAIEKAIAVLGLNRDEIDVEVIEDVKPGFLFRGGKVKIRVHLESNEEEQDEMDVGDDMQGDVLQGDDLQGDVLQGDALEEEIAGFLNGLIERMGLNCSVKVSDREGSKLKLDIQTDDSGILIGKKGRTLEAVQLIVNIFAGRRGDGTRKVIIDTENYRGRREQKLIQYALGIAEDVRRTGSSRLLDAMNPFERRLIHTALNDVDDIETESEGEGLYKRINVMYTGQKRLNRK